MSYFVRSRALPVVTALAISTTALVLFMREAHAQEAAKPTAAENVPAGGAASQLPPVVVEPANEPQPAAGPASKPVKKNSEAAAEPAKPKVKAVKKAAPKPVQQAAPAIEQEEPAAEPALANATGTYNTALDLEGIELPPGTTITTAGPVVGYRAISAMSSTKTATPIEQIPQSIQVIPQQVIKDQTNLTVGEAIQNASNTQTYNSLNIGNTDMAGSKVRGFKAEQWLDGLVVNYNTGDRDAFANVERIEVLKGPSAILYGGGSGAPVGGAINVVSKLPTDKASGAIGSTFGSNSYARPYFDINQPLSVDGTALFRITGEYTSAGSFVDVLEQDRYSINPTLSLTNKTDTTLTIQGRVSRFEQQAYPGLPVVGTIAGDFRIDRDLFAGDPEIERSYSEVQGLTVTFDHRFNDVWSFNVKSRLSQSEFDQNSQGPLSGTPDAAPLLFPTTWSLANVEVFQEQKEFTINPSVQAKFTTGPAKNVVLFGADYSRSTDQGHMFADFAVAPADLLNPIFITPYTDPDPTTPFFVPFFDFENVYSTKGVYSQLQTTLYDRVHLLGGLRWASIDVSYLEKAIFDPTTFAFVPQTFTTEESKLLPRAGIVLDVVDGLSVYASYSESMRWAGFNQARSVAPELADQREVGIKFNAGQQLAGTLAVFDIDRSNIPAVTGFAVAELTDQNSRGFEADLIWQPSRNWQILANYGYVEAEISSGLRDGVQLAEVPAHSGRVWVNYAFDERFLNGWSVGAGLYAADGQFVDIDNLYKTEGYFTVDAKIGYDSGNFAASFNVKNLTGEEYFVPYAWFGGQVAPGDDRAYYGSVAYKY